MSHQVYAGDEPDYFGGADKLTNIDDEISDYEFIKITIIIIITWVLLLDRRLIKFWLYLIFIACLLEGFGLGFILNLEDLEMAALLIIGFLIVIFGRLFGGGGKG